MLKIRDTLKPAQPANDFVVTVADSDWSQRWIDLISNQTTGLDINLVWKRVTLYVRQLNEGYIQDLIFHILKDEYRKIDEVRVSPIKAGPYEIVFSDGCLVDHEASFSYYDKDELVHVLVIEFQKVTLHSPNQNAPTPTVKIDDAG